jgi:hypothetical protein
MAIDDSMRTVGRLSAYDWAQVRGWVVEQDEVTLYVPSGV